MSRGQLEDQCDFLKHQTLRTEERDYINSNTSQNRQDTSKVGVPLVSAEEHIDIQLCI